MASKPALDRASHLVAGAPLMWIQSCSAYYVFEGSASTIQPCLKFPILQVLQCDNPGASYALYIFSIKECRKLQVECGKSHRFKVHIDTNSVRDSRVWDENALVISSISESARHLYSEGGKYPNKQSRITFDYAAMRQI